MTRYPKSRLPGPAVRLFDLEPDAADPDATVRRSAHNADTVASSPEAEHVLTEECR